MAVPEWLASQIQDRTRSADALGAAADQMNQCMAIAAGLNGKHHTDPAWQDAVVESHRLEQVAAGHGFDEYAIADEAARRRTA